MVNLINFTDLLTESSDNRLSCFTVYYSSLTFDCTYFIWLIIFIIHFKHI